MTERQHASDWGWQWRHLKDATEPLLAPLPSKLRAAYLRQAVARINALYQPMLLDLAMLHRLIVLLKLVPPTSTLPAIPTLEVLAGVKSAQLERRLGRMSKVDKAELAQILAEIPWVEHDSMVGMQPQIMALSASAQVLLDGFTAAPMAVYEDLEAAGATDVSTELVKTLVMTALADTQAYMPALDATRPLTEPIPAEFADVASVPGLTPTLRLLPELDLSRFAGTAEIRSIVEQSEQRIVSELAASSKQLQNEFHKATNNREPRLWQWRLRSDIRRIDRDLDTIRAALDSVALVMTTHFAQLHAGQAATNTNVSRLLTELATSRTEIASARREIAAAHAERFTQAELTPVVNLVRDMSERVRELQPALAMAGAPVRQQPAREMIPSGGNGDTFGDDFIARVEKEFALIDANDAPKLIAPPKPPADPRLRPPRPPNQPPVLLYFVICFVVIWSFVAMIVWGGMSWRDASRQDPNLGFNTWLHQEASWLPFAPAAPASSTPSVPALTPSPSAHASLVPPVSTAATQLASREASWAKALKGNGQLIGKTCFMPADVTSLKADGIPAAWYKPHLCPAGHLTPALIASIATSPEVKRLARTSAANFWGHICIGKPSSPKAEANAYYLSFNIPVKESLALLRACPA